MRQVYGPRWPWLLALYLSLAVICGYISWSRVVVDASGVVYTNQDSVALMVETRSANPTGLASWPQMRSRLLVPVIIVTANDRLGIPYAVTHDALRLAFIIAAVLVFHWYLRTWFSLLESLAGTLLMLVTVTITFNNWIPVATDFPELLGMTICAGLLVRRRWFWMLVALFVATLNRETAVLLAIVACVWLYTGYKSLGRVVAVGALVIVTWAGAYSFARAASNVGAGSFVQQEQTAGQPGAGFVSQVNGLVRDLWPRRRESFLSLLNNPHPYNVNWAPFLMFNIIWALPLLAWRGVPPGLRRLYVGGLLSGALMFVLVGVLNEAGRHLIPLYPLLYPAALHVLVRHVAPSASPA